MKLIKKTYGKADCRSCGKNFIKTTINKCYCSTACTLKADRRMYADRYVAAKKLAKSVYAQRVSLTQAMRRLTSQDHKTAFRSELRRLWRLSAI